MKFAAILIAAAAVAGSGSAFAAERVSDMEYLKASRCKGLATTLTGVVDAGSIDCPVRVVWGTADRILEWPRAALRFRDDWLPGADWVELDGVGHCPQLDVPAEPHDRAVGWVATPAGVRRLG